MNELPKETQIWRLGKFFAVRNNLPVVFSGRALGETAKAVYIYGHGTVEAQTRFGACFICGTRLQHPGSIMLGIGPICLGNMGLRDQMIRGKNQTEIDAIIGKMIVDKKVDCWIPKSCILEYQPSKEEIIVPADHPRMKTPDGKVKLPPHCSQIKYQDTGKPGIKIEFPFDADLLAKVKGLSGRRFHNEGDKKFWTCPLILDSAQKLKAWGFQMSDKLEEFISQSTLSINDVGAIDIPGLKKTLFDFQGQGVAFFDARNGRAMCADDMGLGKTVQALGYLQLHRELRPAVIVLPASVKYQWEAMTNDWLPDPNVQILSGTSSSLPIIGDIILINYDILQYWLEALQAIHPKVLIMDECHYIKNSKALRTKAVKALAKGVPHVIGLSGTPATSRPIELYNAINVIDSTVVPNFWTFAMRYCGARHNGYGWDFSGASNTEELHNLLVNSIMIRRRKDEVLKDLPPKIRSFVPMDLDNFEEYKRVEMDYINWVREQKGDKAAYKASQAEHLSKIEALKQVCVAGKLRASIEWVRDFTDIKKLALFCTHTSVVDRLMAEFSGSAIKIDGSTPQTRRYEICQEFQRNDGLRLFVGNVKAAGIGVTLTAADSAAFLELPWTPGDLDQAEDRVHRISQTKQVTIYYLLAYRSIEERIARLLDSKRVVLKSIMDGREVEAGSLLTELINSYLEEAA